MTTFIKWLCGYKSTNDMINADFDCSVLGEVGSLSNTPRTPRRRKTPPQLENLLSSIKEERNESVSDVASVVSSESSSVMDVAASQTDDLIRQKVECEVFSVLQKVENDIKKNLQSDVRSIVAIQLHSTLKNIVAAELNAKLNHKISIAKKEIMADVEATMTVVTKMLSAKAPPPLPPQNASSSQLQLRDAGTQYRSAAAVPTPCVCNKRAGPTCLLHARTLKETILQLKPIEQNLHVIAVISNPCNFHRREQLMREFTQRMEREPNVILYTVELSYGDQPFRLTTRDCPRHLQLRTNVPLWHKENMINLGVRYLLPRDWRAMAWIDADIDFENPSWALDTLKVLNGYRDIVQLFSHAVDMDASEATMNVYNSFGFQHDKGLPYTYKFPNYWHPGYAWAVTREAFEKMRTPGDPYSGIFELGILGASDHIMTFCYRGNGLASINDKYTAGFKEEITKFEGRVSELRLGYVPGVIRHYFHGSKVNRKYVERNEILLRHHYNPARHIMRDASGVFVPTAEFPADFAREIYEYFVQRNEDE